MQDWLVRHDVGVAAQYCARQPRPKMVPFVRSAIALLALALLLGLGWNVLTSSGTESFPLGLAAVVAGLSVLSVVQLWRGFRVPFLGQMVLWVGFRPEDVPVTAAGRREAARQEMFARAGSEWVAAAEATSAVTARLRRLVLVLYALAGATGIVSLVRGQWLLICLVGAAALIVISRRLSSERRDLVARVPLAVAHALGLPSVIMGEGPMSPRPGYLTWCAEAGFPPYPFGSPPVHYERSPEHPSAEV